MQWIKDIVTGLIETYGTKDVFELLDFLDVTIIKKKFIDPDVKARFYKDIFGYDYIYISIDLTDQEKKYILCHELGHIILHDITSEYYYSSKVNKGKLEMQANYFASLLLLDESDIELCSIENMSMDQLSSYFELPAELLQFRLEEMLSDGS